MGVLVKLGWISFAKRFLHPFQISFKKKQEGTNTSESHHPNWIPTYCLRIPDETNSFFEAPWPSAHTSIFIGFLGILIMAYCDENCGRFFTPLHSLYLFIYIEINHGHKPSVRYAKATRRWYFQKPVKTSWVVFARRGNLVKPWQGGVVAFTSRKKEVFVFVLTQFFVFLFQFGIYVGCAKKFNGNWLKIIFTTIHYYINLLTSTPAIEQIYWRHPVVNSSSFGPCPNTGSQWVLKVTNGPPS